MLFFYKSHTPIFSYTGHFKKIYNAVKCTIPTQILKKGVQWKKYLKNKKAIGETDNSKKSSLLRLLCGQSDCGGGADPADISKCYAFIIRFVSCDVCLQSGESLFMYDRKKNSCVQSI